jgi:hypothetical protein
VNNSAITVSFPTDNSQESQLARLHTATVTLQNLRGPGVGCPSASTTFNQQAQAIQNGTSASPPAAQELPPAPKSGGVDLALVPQFGHAAGLDPTGTGNCAGITNSAGAVIEIPCSCPPDRNSFVQVKKKQVFMIIFFDQIFSQFYL